MSTFLYLRLISTKLTTCIWADDRKEYMHYVLTDSWCMQRAMKYHLAIYFNYLRLIDKSKNILHPIWELPRSSSHFIILSKHVQGRIQEVLKGNLHFYIVLTRGRGGGGGSNPFHNKENYSIDKFPLNVMFPTFWLQLSLILAKSK